MSEPRIVLYGRRAPLTEKVARGLRLKRLAFELVEPADPEDHARLSPETGLLPLLEVEGIRTPDSAAILDFLDERFPEPRLVSADPRAALSLIYREVYEGARQLLELRPRLLAYLERVFGATGGSKPI